MDQVDIVKDLVVFRTNLPKEVMGFPDFPMPKGDVSYLPQKDVLQFLHDYAKKFDLVKHIKVS